MADVSQGGTPEAQAGAKVAEITKAATRWAREAPAKLAGPVRAVCLRLAELVADQRHTFSPLPSAQEIERRAVLTHLAKRLSSSAVTTGLEKEMAALTELELRSTGSWSLVPTAQAQWIITAVQYLERCARELPKNEQPDDYWADDVVAGIIASVRVLIGVDELAARTEAQYPGAGKPPVEEE